MSEQGDASQAVEDAATPTAPPPNNPLHIGKPAWLKTTIPTGGTYFQIKKDLRERQLFTVCEEAKCPNIGQCWNQRTATFMVLGDTCTRGCRFCNVKTGNPGGWLDPREAEQTALAAKTMQLRYAVITMVDRDDLPDGGAAHVAQVLQRVKELNPGIRVEILAGDFRESDASLTTLARSRPEVFAHNLETVERLTPRVRDARANYRQSLRVLRRFKDLVDYPVVTKSALMLGLGETLAEVEATLADMREHGVDFVTIGQYMRPTKKHLSIKRFVPPAEFDQLAASARALGFKSVVSGPLVRSSYQAGHYYDEAMKPRP
jgi:lipoic acid synthetase